MDGCTRFEGAVARDAAHGAAGAGGRPSLFGAIFIWNEFLVALYVIDSREFQTIALGAATLVSAQRPIDWNIAAAVGVVTVGADPDLLALRAALHRARADRGSREVNGGKARLPNDGIPGGARTDPSGHERQGCTAMTEENDSSRPFP